MLIISSSFQKPSFTQKIIDEKKRRSTIDRISIPFRITISPGISYDIANLFVGSTRNSEMFMNKKMKINPKFNEINNLIIPRLAWSNALGQNIENTLSVFILRAEYFIINF
jgi:hypothetical protein